MQEAKTRWAKFSCCIACANMKFSVRRRGWCVAGGMDTLSHGLPALRHEMLRQAQDDRETGSQSVCELSESHCGVTNKGE